MGRPRGDYVCVGVGEGVCGWVCVCARVCICDCESMYASVFSALLDPLLNSYSLNQLTTYLSYSILPCLALPCLALPCLALPCLALPCLALPCLALP